MASDFELADSDDGFAGFRDKITHAFSHLPNPTGGIPILLTATRWPLRMGGAATRSGPFDAGKN